MHLKNTVGRIGMVIALGAAVGAMSMGPALAASPHGQTISITQNYHGVFPEPNATNPCTGGTFNGGAGIMFTGSLVNHVTYFTASDELWATFTETGAISGTDDTTGATYTGHATAWGNFNMNERNQNSEFTLTIHATGSDGTSITAHETTVFVENGIGDITVNFDKMSLSCG